MTLKQRLFTNWHLMRIMRGVIGIMLLGMGIQSRDWTVSLFSSFFLFQAITDTGCCGSQGCYISAKTKMAKAGDIPSENMVDYEEVK